jgi:hypothetical protein
MINITYIYLIEGIEHSPNRVYIGKTINPLVRKGNHKRKYGNHIKYTIIDQINSIKSDDWKPLESYWIEQFRQWGFDIINKNKGGGGSNFRTEEQKEKIRKHKLGKKLSTETKLKISKSNSKPKPKGFGIKLRKPNTKKISYRPIIQYDLQGNFIKEWCGCTEASNNLKINIGSISSCCTGKYKTAGGFIWMYL